MPARQLPLPWHHVRGARRGAGRAREPGNAFRTRQDAARLRPGTPASEFPPRREGAPEEALATYANLGAPVWADRALADAGMLSAGTDSRGCAAAHSLTANILDVLLSYDHR